MNSSNNNHIPMRSVIIFGGSGFIGTHLSKYLIEKKLAQKVYCVDLVEPRYELEHLEYIQQDVRKPFRFDIKAIDAIYNLAAIHTTPGHLDWEYFETNIRGAENVCSFAQEQGINRIVFTSSISPYGVSEELKKENDLPQPNSAYGSSKLAAEYIHKCWMEASCDRKLSIVRPGVVFGYEEGGNFTRLYNSLKKRYFFYPGRKDTKKACVYVKDIMRALHEMSIANERFQMFNMCYSESSSIEDIVYTISTVTGVKNNNFVIPGWLLKTAASILKPVFALTNNKNGIHPDRVKKLMMSTNISGEKLSQSPYALRYPLKEAIEDWYKDCDKKGLF